MNNAVTSLAVSGAYLFAGTYTGGVWRRPLTEMITSVQFASPQIPDVLTLRQNYPNPFNSTTTISFNLQGKSFVSLRVFNDLGREVADLISEELSAGLHQVSLNGVNLPAGTYFFRSQTEKFRDTKKLILAK